MAIYDVETEDDLGGGEKSPAEVSKRWLDAIATATKEEESWIKDAEEAVRLYRSKGSQKGSTQDVEDTYNILYSNIDTITPALYNSLPVPDIRRRFGEPDEAGRKAAQALERSLSFGLDVYDFDATIRAAVQDSELAGRGVTRVRYIPTIEAEEPEEQTNAPTSEISESEGEEALEAGETQGIIGQQYVEPTEQVTYEQVICEHVPWRSFRHGPGKMWEDVTWVAFQHFLTREELIKLSPEIGPTLQLDYSADGLQDTKEPNDKDKRALVWEVWDKSSRKVCFIAPSYKHGPIKEEEDPLNLFGFFPIPRPLYAVQTSDSLVPIEPYNYYRTQAKELDIITRRITALIEVLKWRGFRSSEIDEIDRLNVASDGDLLPITNPAAFAGKNGLEGAIYLMPIDKVVSVLQNLYRQRDQIKQIIYEVTGIADVLRGSTNPNETLGAQQLKAQWGSMRLQRKQNDVARYIRDLFRLKAEIIAEKFSPQLLTMITGVEITPDVEQILRNDFMRQYRVDIETDSTIKADLARSQQNISGFLTGFSQFLAAIGPAVQSGNMPKDVAADLLTSFARQFKLGRQAEDALERLGQQAQQEAQMAQQAQAGPQPPDMQVMAAQQAQQSEMEAKQADVQAKQAMAGIDQQVALTKAQVEQEKARLDLELRQQEHAMRMQELMLQHQIRMRELETRASRGIVDGSV